MVVERGERRHGEDLAMLVDGCWALGTNPLVRRWRRKLGRWALEGYKARVLRVATLADLEWFADPERPLPPEVRKRCEEQIIDLARSPAGPEIG